jgi:hypothetical protein
MSNPAISIFRTIGHETLVRQMRTPRQQSANRPRLTRRARIYIPF